MAAIFDINLIPLYRVQGQEWPQLPGLMATIPPKHAARGRDGDALVVYLSLTGNAPVSSTEYNQIAAQMAQRYYQVPGALTSAMRAAVEAFNQYLVDRNMRSSGQGQHAIGRLILAVLREDQLTLAQCGPTRSFQITSSGTTAIHDANISGRGLGIGPSAPIFLSQTEVHSGDQLVLCTQCPAEWDSDLPKTGGSTLEKLRRGLFDATGEDVNGVVMQVLTGKGAVNILRGESQAAPVPAAIPATAAAPGGDAKSPEAPSEGMTPTSAEPGANLSTTTHESNPTRLDLQQPGRFVRPLGTHSQGSQTQGSQTRGTQSQENLAKDASTPTMSPTAEAAGRQSTPAASRAERRGRFITPRPLGEIPEISRESTQKDHKLALGLARSLRRTRLTLGKISQAVKRFLPRLLPGIDNNDAPRTGAAMGLVAVAVPLVIIVAAVIVYMQYGQASQYKDNYNKAVNAAVGAIDETDPASLRVAWESSLHYLDLAEQYQVTPESKALRQQAETALDGLDGIIRLDLRAAIYGGLDPSIRVTRMAATGSELYMLDASTGNVLRASLTSQGYAVDLSFICGPGVYGEGAIRVGPLIDLAVMPGGNEHHAPIVAMDENGTLLYCAPEETDPEAYMISVPPLGWQQITGFTLSSNGREMYVMDKKAVWIYSYSVHDTDPVGTKLNFIDPTAYFSGQVPLNMEQAIDVAANGNDLFLLFADSHVTVCTYDGLKSAITTCKDPATFTDRRAGHKSGTTLTDAVFSQLAFDAPYNTALYLLEPNTRAVYTVSPHPSSLELGGQFHGTWEEERTLFQNQPATAITIDTNRYLFLCIGNQVYFAAIP